jgi:hypothetical protein
MKLSTLRNQVSISRPESGRQRVKSAKSYRADPNTPKDSDRERQAIENANNVIQEIELEQDSREMIMPF